jgi:hypothetical protein
MNHVSCCRTAAQDIAAAFCNVCGQHLVRCTGFTVCGGLLYPGSGHCHEHLMLQGRFRSRLDGLSRDDDFSLELDLTNIGAADLEITEAFTRLGDSVWTPHQPSYAAWAASGARATCHWMGASSR